MVCDYDAQRLENIERNRRVLYELGCIQVIAVRRAFMTGACLQPVTQRQQNALPRCACILSYYTPSCRPELPGCIQRPTAMAIALRGSPCGTPAARYCLQFNAS